MEIANFTPMQFSTELTQERKGPCFKLKLNTGISSLTPSVFTMPTSMSIFCSTVQTVVPKFIYLLNVYACGNSAVHSPYTVVDPKKTAITTPDWLTRIPQYNNSHMLI